MSKPIIHADFNNADQDGRLRLNCVGSISDLARAGVKLADGMELVLHDEELEADGIVQFSSEDGWVARIDWRLVRSKSSVSG